MTGKAAALRGYRRTTVALRRKTTALEETVRKFGMFGARKIGEEPEIFPRRMRPAGARRRPVRFKPAPDKDLLEELRKSLKRMKVLEGLTAEYPTIPKSVGPPDEDVVEPQRARRLRRTPFFNRRRTVALLVVAILIGVAVGWALYSLGAGPPNALDSSQPRWKDESATHFTFAAAGDFGGSANQDSIALVERARTAGMSFLLALGDLGYTTDESGWCAEMKRYLPELVIVAGSLEDGEKGGEDISNYVASCPYPLPSPIVPGNGTPGYGYEYYFDYPRDNPLARFVMLSAGLTGTFNYNYSKESPHTEWAEHAVESARDSGIPWVVAGIHKGCITVGRHDDCSMGQDIFDELVEAKVDLILVGHDHVYERSKQLKLSSSCESVESKNQFEPDCVVSNETQGLYPKGDGTVVVVQGVGGQYFDNVAINGSDREIGYFDAVMGGNANTQGRLSGFGSVFYEVTRASITAKTNFCPPESVGTNGQCTVDSTTVFTDQFSIAVEAAGFATFVSPGPGLVDLPHDSFAMDAQRASPMSTRLKD